ncbi:MAG: ankyrin repeat domain-containing protein [Kiritimatiellaeota bacterium]|nr:ankyrin repeat domain-containing protein [Kiritimatiellota bacterium]
MFYLSVIMGVVGLLFCLVTTLWPSGGFFNEWGALIVVGCALVALIIEHRCAASAPGKKWRWPCWLAGLSLGWFALAAAYVLGYDRYQEIRLDVLASSSVHQAFAAGPDERILRWMKSKPELIEKKDDYHCTALHYAARYGRIQTAKWLIKHKADVNTVAYNQFTPMHVVENGDVARLLIQAGANLDAKDAWGKTPLQAAAEMKKTNVCGAILASGYLLDLKSALMLGKRDAAKKILRENPAVVKAVETNSDLWMNTSPLGVAAAQGDFEMVTLLLQAGAPVNAVTERPNAGEMTALCNAVWAGHYEVAELLCKAGADCNMTGGRFDRRLLDYALQHSDKKMVALLVKYGAKPTEKNAEIKNVKEQK